jgi:N6-L-threonylcarbamoyladenine synthase
VNVLAIESSCDETAAAVLGDSGVLSDVIWSQRIHEAYGGVVPELASRAHAEQIVPVVRAALDQAGIERPDAVAATAGPGLVGAVLVGLSFAKSAALGWGVPFYAVNHLEGHLLSALLEPDPPAFPFLALVVSGGHTTLYRADALGRYSTLAETVDDAVGEAYDKVARMLGLGYPGGPHVDALAALGNPTVIPLPRPKVGDLDMSFSGLKTAVRAVVERHPDARPADIAASFQEAICDVLCDRALRAAERTGIRTLTIGGGVAANARLRARLAALPLDVRVPPRARCTDNAAMIANVARLRLLAGAPGDSLATTARPRWEVGAP